MQKIMKRLFIMVMAAMLLLLPMAAQAASSGTCGASLNWTLNDAGTLILAREIVKRIEREMEYPGQIKVNVIRETRAVEFAK